jgi:hypothetical protein
VAKSALPGPLERRHLLERELPEAQALRLAEAYLAAGRPLDAVGFLAKAGARERLEALRNEAIASGDVFMLRASCEAVGVQPTREEWRETAKAAAAAGKGRYAEQAARQADRGED